MELYVVLGILIIAVFAASFYFNRTPAKVVDQQSKDKDKVKPELSEEEKKVRADNRNLELAALTLPTTFPDELIIYFGSQTGNSEKFAHVLDKEASQIGINSKVVDIEKFTPEEFASHKLAILVLATHYEGDPTDTAKAFHKWLKNSVKSEN